MTVLPYVPVGIIRVFFNFRFFNRNSQSQKKLAKKITYFTISFRSKNFTYFKKFNSFDLEKNMAKQTQHSQIPFSIYKFYGKVWLVSEKNIWIAPIFRRPRTAFSKHYESKCLCVSVYLRKNIFVRKTWEAFIWWTGEGGGGREGRRS